MFSKRHPVSVSVISVTLKVCFVYNYCMGESVMMEVGLAEQGFPSLPSAGIEPESLPKHQMVPIIFFLYIRVINRVVNRVTRATERREVSNIGGGIGIFCQK